MKILDRYVLATFVKNYLLSFMCLVGLYVVLDMLFNFQDLLAIQTKEGLTGLGSVGGLLKTIGGYYFYQIFLFFVHLSGIIPVVASAFTLMRMSRFNELSALLSSGVPLLRVTMPVILASVALNGLLLVDQELVIPEMIPKLTRSHSEANQAEGRNVWPIPSMQASTNDHFNLLVAARYLSAAPQTGVPTLEKMDVIYRDATLRVIGHLTADLGEWDETRSGWRLTHARLERGLQSDRPTESVSADVLKDAPAKPNGRPGGRRGARGEARDGAAGAPATTPAAAASVAAGAEWPTRFADTDFEAGGEKVMLRASTITPDEIVLYKNAENVSLLSTEKINQLLNRQRLYGVNQLMRVQHQRFTQPLLNIILLLLTIPTVLTRQPTRLKAAATKCLFLAALCMGTVFLSQLLASRPPSKEMASQWPAIMAWVPIFIFGPLSVFLLDRVET